MPGASERLARQVTAFVQELRTADLYKAAGISETLDWAAALVALDREVLDADVIDETLGILLKNQEDIDSVRGERMQTSLGARRSMGSRSRASTSTRANAALVHQPPALWPRPSRGGCARPPRADGRRDSGDRMDRRQAAANDLRATLCALLVHRHDDLPLFNEAFDLFFRAHGSSELDLPLFSLGRARARRDEARRGRATAARRRGVARIGRGAAAAFALGAYSTVEVSRTKDFADFTAAELEAARRLLLRMPWEPGMRRTRRWTARVARRHRHAAAAAHEPDARWRVDRAAASHPPRCAASDRAAGGRQRIDGSIQPHAAAFASGLTRSARQVESFVFATRLTRVSRHVAAAGGHRVVSRLVRDLHDWGGGTRIGDALRTFNTTWARRVMRHGPVVLIVSDGWDRGDPALLGRELARLRRRCSRLIWLNPLLGSAGYEPLTRGMQAALEHIDDFMPAHNLPSLEQPRRASSQPHDRRVMEITATIAFAAAPAEVWKLLMDPEAIKSCLPGCRELRPIGDNRYHAEITIGVARRRPASFTATVALSEQSPPHSYRLSVDATGKPGFAKGSGADRAVASAVGHADSGDGISRSRRPHRARRPAADRRRRAHDDGPVFQLSGRPARTSVTTLPFSGPRSHPYTYRALSFTPLLVLRPS